MSFKFWLSLHHKCHITGGYVTCSLLIHYRSNGILLLLWNFRIKTKGVHLLVAKRKSLLPTCHKSPTLLSDQFGSPKLEFFKSINVKSPKRSLVHFSACRGCCIVPVLIQKAYNSSTWGLHLTWSDLTSTQKLSWLLVTLEKFWSTNQITFWCCKC